jgi:hypothetical protein
MYTVHNNISRFCPFEWFAVFVPVFNIVPYRRYSFFNAAPTLPPYPFIRYLGKPPLYQIQPRRMRWNKMYLEFSGNALKVFFHFLRFMRGIIIRYDMQRLPRLTSLINYFEQFTIIFRLMVFLAFPYHFPG